MTELGDDNQKKKALTHLETEQYPILEAILYARRLPYGP